MPPAHVALTASAHPELIGLIQAHLRQTPPAPLATLVREVFVCPVRLPGTWGLTRTSRLRSAGGSSSVLNSSTYLIARISRTIQRRSRISKSLVRRTTSAQSNKPRTPALVSSP